MLPFLNKKNQSGITSIVVKNRQPDETTQESDKDDPIHACASDLIEAVHSKDVKRAAEAMRSAFEILEKQPHEEVEHTESEE